MDLLQINWGTFFMNKKIKILHLEDNQTDAELVKEILSLEDIDFSIINVDNEKDFLKALKNKTFDLILADYSLPSFDGLSALKLVQEQEVFVPFIFVSGVLGEELGIEAMKSGATDYVLKSRFERLVPTIRRSLREVEDLVQRKRLEKNISELEEVYTKIAERVRGFLKMELPSGKFSIVDKFIEELSGYSVKDWQETPNFILKIVHPDFQEYFNENFQKMLEGVIPKVLEYRIIRKEGDERWWLQFNIGAYDINQKLVSVSIVIIDNTDSMESHLKYQNLFENAIVGMFRTSFETGRIIDANETMANIFGCSSVEEFKQFTTIEFFPNEEQRKEFLEAIQKDGFVIGYHMPLKRKDGSEIWVSHSGRFFHKEGFIEGIMIDISEQKKAEEALRESEEKYRTLFNEMPIGILTCDKNGVIQSVNKAALQILGSPSEEATKGINLLTFPLLVDAGISSDLKICLEKGDPIKSEKEYKTKWGKEIIIQYKGIPIKDKDGNIIGALSTFEDVSERKLAEKLLIDSERRYRLLAENVTDVIFTLDLDWKITYVSPSIEFLIGFKDEEVLPKTLDEILEPSSLELALKILAEELIIEDSDDKDLLRSIITELEFRCKDGSNVWTEAKVTFLRDKDEKAIGILGVIRDISQRKEMKG